MNYWRVRGLRPGYWSEVTSELQDVATAFINPLATTSFSACDLSSVTWELPQHEVQLQEVLYLVCSCKYILSMRFYMALLASGDSMEPKPKESVLQAETVPDLTEISIRNPLTLACWLTLASSGGRRLKSMLLLKGQICLPCPWLLLHTTPPEVAFSWSYQCVNQTRLEVYCLSVCGFVCGRRKAMLWRGSPFFFQWNGSLHLSIFHKDLVCFLNRNTRRLWWSTAFVSVFLNSAGDPEYLLMCSESDLETSQPSLPTAWHEVQLILVL